MIIAVTDRTISAERDFLEQIEKIAEASPDMLILREKDLTEPQYRYLAIECARICGLRNIRFCINSFIKIASQLNNERIQLSFDSFKNNKDGLGHFKEIWVSVHSKKEAIDAEALGATHLIYGNVFETSCKPNAESKGIRSLIEVCYAVQIPVFAIGGINENNIRSIMETGCGGVCVRSLLMTSNDPVKTMESLRIKEK